MQAKPLVFLKEAQAELKKVDWPNKQTLIKLTGIVIGVSVAMALFAGGLDLLFTKLMSLLIK